jgi:hypothetical protein
MVVGMRALAGTLLVTMLMNKMRLVTSMGRSGMMVTVTLRCRSRWLSRRMAN